MSFSQYSNRHQQGTHDELAVLSFRLQRLLKASTQSHELLVCDEDGVYGTAPLLNPALVADLLRSTSATLAQLGVFRREPPAIRDERTEGRRSGLREWSDGDIVRSHERAKPHAKANSYEPTLFWNRLLECLKTNQPADALIVFKKLAKALRTEAFMEHMPVMRQALASPAWRVQAIEAVPDFFLRCRINSSRHFRGSDEQGANALQVLATLAPGCDPSDREQTLDTIRALKRIGVQDFPDPSTNETCLQLAAYYRSTASFQAFVEEFTSEVDLVGKNNYRPLDYAAQSSFPGNVKLLLEAGANPRPHAGSEMSPVAKALLKDRIDSALALLGTGAYDEDEVARAIPGWLNDDHVEKLKSFHAAVKAQQAVNGARDDDPSMIRPL